MTARNEDRTVRVGVVVPADCRLDHELWALCDPGVVPYITRTNMPRFEQVTPMSVELVTNLAESHDIDDAARQLIAVEPAAIGYLETGIAFIRGAIGARELRQRISEAGGAPATVGALAVVEALVDLESKHVAVVTPYPDPINRRLASFLKEYSLEVEGLAVTRTNYGDGCTSSDLALIPNDELCSAVVAAATPRTEAVFIACTAVRTLGALAALERRFTLPFVSTIQATMWHLQRLAGVETPAVQSAGRLFQRYAEETDRTVEREIDARRAGRCLL